MPETTRTTPPLALFAACVALALPTAPASWAAASGKIVCWKDASGKVVGCGDQVPPEYRGTGTSELDKRGVTRRTTESTEEATKRKEKDAELAREKAEEKKRLADQRRQDTALLGTYNNEHEIDARRDRDLQVIDLQVQQLEVSLKNAAARLADTRSRIAQAEKAKKPVPPALSEDVTRIEAEQSKIEANIAAKHKEKEEVQARFVQQKKRFLELKGASAPGAKK